jgi:predicted ATPase
MASYPFLKSIRPVNLLSFGPNTEEIELRPLNILIGPNGSGKSNLIEVVRLLHYLPDKDPWSVVLNTGGVDEWIWQGKDKNDKATAIFANIALERIPVGSSFADIRQYEYSISLAKLHSSFYVRDESFRRANISNTDGKIDTSFESSGTTGTLNSQQSHSNFSQNLTFQLNPERSVLSQRTSPNIQDALIGKYMPALFEVGEFFENLDFHQDWEFGADLPPRDPRPAGQPVERLEENAYNLAQMLAHFRDYHRPIYDRVNELMKQFYEPFNGVEVRVLGTHLQVAMMESGGFSTSAYRLSDGTLRWLALLVILLNPSPAPVTCIEEPELGLHPDILPTLADLLIDASTRTQLIVTTHSRSFIDSFTDTPEAVCVCEKVEGSTVIQRLERDRLKEWLEEYSLGKVWTRGEIGGNRW